jgi:predicted DNA-binding transcriptional regulator YafY
MSDLMEEFNMSDRNINRDLAKLKLFFPIEKNKLKQYHFSDGFTLNKTTLKNDEMLFVYLSLSQIKDINKNFEKATHSIFSKLLTPRYEPAYHIKSNSFENIDIDSSLLNDIESAIEYKNSIFLTLPNRGFTLEPYKVVSFDGIWYLFGRDINDKKIKTVFIHQIKKLEIKEKKFNIEKPIDEILENVHSAWFEDGNCMEVIIKVHGNIAYNFKLKKILPSQEILEEYEDESLLVKFTVTTEEDIDNIIKAWLPNIEIISPKSYRDKLVKELEKYISLYRN